MIYEYIPQGVCSMKIILDIEENIVKDAKIVGGCDGNTKGVCSLIKGMKVDDVINKLKGIDCRMRGTSCPDQLARALEEYRINN